MAKKNKISYWIDAGGMNPKVDIFLSKTKKWQEELEQLRRILLDCQLTEELKWGVTVYTFQNSNIVGINEVNDHLPSPPISKLMFSLIITF